MQVLREFEPETKQKSLNKKRKEKPIPGPPFRRSQTLRERENGRE
jgi:hypothetical protein